QGVPGAGMVLARGRFDEVRIESLMREHGARVEDYNGSRVIVADVEHPDSDPSVSGQTRQTAHSFALSFIEPGLAGFGSTEMIKSAIDLHKSGSSSQSGPQSASLNEELMTRVRAMDDGNAWVVGRFDVLRSQAHLPDEVSSRIPPITWVTAKAHID